MEQNTMDIRQMPEIQAIAEYLRNMKFKRKRFGGVDPESVLDHFSEITLQYEAIVSAYAMQCGRHAAQSVEFQSRIARMEREHAAYEAYYRELIQWYEGTNAYLKTHNEELQRQVATLWEQRRWTYAPQ